MKKSKRKAFIDQEKCQCPSKCQALKACPFGAISQERKWFFKLSRPEINTHRCAGCGECIKFCPHHAISLG